jgi:glycosyltransferase involved in cell wall biosynthesis
VSTPNHARRTVVFLYANEPNPGLLERMATLHESGDWEVHAIYWQRLRSNISIPFTSSIPEDRFHPITLADPRGAVPRRLLLTMRFIWAARKLIRQIKPDSVHAVNADILAVARFVLVGSKRTALVFDMQDQMGDRLPVHYRTAYQWLLRRADAMLIRSEGFTSFVEQNQLFGHGKPVLYVTNAPAKWTLRHAPTSSRPELVVGYFGNIRGPKQVQALIDAAEQVQATGRDVRLLFAGVGPEVSMVQQAGERLAFLEYTGPYDYETEYAGLQERADLIYALYPQETPNYRTHIARRFHETILAGMPIIVTRGTHMGDIVKSSSVGWEVGDGSVADLVQLLSDLYDNRSLLAKATDDEEMLARHRFETYEPILLKAHADAVASRG